MNLTLEQLETELRRQPAEIRDYLASMLIDTLDEVEPDDAAGEAEAHRRYLELKSGAIEGLDGDEVIAQLMERQRR